MYETIPNRYRPRSLKSVVGQRPAVKQLSGMFKSGNYSRALLLSGDYGIGKTTLANIISRSANCMSEKGTCVPGKKSSYCPSCKQFFGSNQLLFSHQDITHINIGDDTGVDNMRSVIQSSRYLPMYNYRVIVMDEFHQASKAAQNALLIPLENPPAKTIFILCSSQPEKIIPTIVSRCLHIKLAPVEDEEMKELISRVSEKESISLSKKNRNHLLRLSEGRPRVALMALESVSNLARSQGQDIDEELISSAISSFGSSTEAEGSAKEYLASLMLGKLDFCLEAVRLVSAPDLFVRVLSDYIVSLVCYQKKVKVKSFYHIGYLTSLKTVAPSGKLKEWLSSVLETERNLKLRSNDPYQLLVNMTLDLFSGTKS